MQWKKIHTCDKSTSNFPEVILAKLLNEWFADRPFGIVSAEIVEKINLKPGT